MKHSKSQSFLFFCLWCISLNALAITSIQLEADKSWSEQFNIKGLTLSLELTPAGFSLKGRALQLELPAPIGIVTNLVVDCPKPQWQQTTYRCDHGEISFDHPLLGHQHVTFSLLVDEQNTLTQLTLNELRLGEGKLSLEGVKQAEQWRISMEAEAIPISKLQPIIASAANEELSSTLNKWHYQAALTATIDITGNSSEIQSVKADWQSIDTNISNTSASQVSENLSLEGNLSLNLIEEKWQWSTNLELFSGQLYSEPVFLDMSTDPIELSAKGMSDPKWQTITVTDLQFKQGDSTKLSGQVTLLKGQLSALSISLNADDLDSLYRSWLQPFLHGTSVADLTLSGRGHATIQQHDDQYELMTKLDNVDVNDKLNRFSLSGVDSSLAWSNAKEGYANTISWQHARVYAIDIGKAQLNATSLKAGFRLSESTSIPILDGELNINALTIENTNTGLQGGFDGILLPVSMQSLTTALDWPEMHGKLSGVIPNVSYQDEQLKIDGALMVKVFDGTTVIRDLTLNKPLGLLPELSANVDLTDLDLNLITDTFDVGNITGRVSGYIHQLRLLNWQPIQFDSMIATSEDNPGKRMISQRAVDNLTQVGGGASGLISRSFLRFFDDFSYRRLGIKCRLQNGVCHMSGVKQAEQGFYIVQGGGGLPPWIDVIGYTREVDWNELLERIKAVQDSPGPVIE